MKAAIYTRLSNADENSTSTQRQETECREYASRHDLEVVEVFACADRDNWCPCRSDGTKRAPSFCMPVHFGHNN